MSVLSLRKHSLSRTKWAVVRQKKQKNDSPEWNRHKVKYLRLVLQQHSVAALKILKIHRLKVPLSTTQNMQSSWIKHPLHKLRVITQRTMGSILSRHERNMLKQ